MLVPDTDPSIDWLNNLLLNDEDAIEFIVSSDNSLSLLENNKNASEIVQSDNVLEKYLPLSDCDKQVHEIESNDNFVIDLSMATLSDKETESKLDLNKPIDSNVNFEIDLSLTATETVKETVSNKYVVNKEIDSTSNFAIDFPMKATVSDTETKSITKVDVNGPIDSNENPELELLLPAAVTDMKRDESIHDLNKQLNSNGNIEIGLPITAAGSEKKSESTFDVNNQIQHIISNGNSEIDSQSLTTDSADPPKNIDVFGEVFKWPSRKRDDVSSNKKVVHKFPVVSADIWQKTELERLQQKE